MVFGILFVPQTTAQSKMCGIFGLLLLDDTPGRDVHSALRKMMRVTMMRGAQSAGESSLHAGDTSLSLSFSLSLSLPLVAALCCPLLPQLLTGGVPLRISGIVSVSGRPGAAPRRTRVVNGKRTQLDELLLRQHVIRNASATVKGPHLYLGHTRCVGWSKEMRLRIPSPDPALPLRRCTVRVPAFVGMALMRLLLLPAALQPLHQRTRSPGRTHTSS